jgi:hypothetical protein
MIVVTNRSRVGLQLTMLRVSPNRGMSAFGKCSGIWRRD